MGEQMEQSDSSIHHEHAMDDLSTIKAFDLRVT